LNYSIYKVLKSHSEHMVKHCHYRFSSLTGSKCSNCQVSSSCHLPENEDDKGLKAQVHYYCREKLYHAMQYAALDGLCKYPGDATFICTMACHWYWDVTYRKGSVNWNHFSLNMMLSWALYWH